MECSEFTEEDFTQREKIEEQGRRFLAVPRQRERPPAGGRMALLRHSAT